MGEDMTGALCWLVIDAIVRRKRKNSPANAELDEDVYQRGAHDACLQAKLWREYGEETWPGWRTT